jgi:DNA-binding phage protein
MSDPKNMMELLNSILEDREQAIALARRVDAGLEPLTPFDPAEFLTSAEAIAFFLEEAEATGDPGFIAHARETAARAKAMHSLDDACPSSVKQQPD